MQRSIRASIFLAAAACGCLAARPASADTITAELTGLNPNAFGDVFLQGAGTVYGGVGNILWQGSASNAAPFNAAYSTYCIDLIQNIQFGNTYTFTEASLASGPKAAAYPSGSPANGMGTAKAAEIEEMYGQHLVDTIGITPAAADAREAFQLAIWNIVYDTDTSVSTGSGTFYATSNIDPAAIADANAFLTDAANPANQAIFRNMDLVALIASGDAQDQIGINPINPITATAAPLPSAAMGGSVLLLCLGLLRYRRQRRDVQ